MKILVTGSNGFLGMNVTKVLSNAHQTFGVNRSLGMDSYTDRDYLLDINYSEKLSRLVGELQIEAIVHCAAKPIVGDCDRDPYGAYHTNTLGTISILEAARRNGVKKTLIVETDKVYGEQTPGTSMTEEYGLNPGSPYELSKALGSMASEFYRNHYGMDIVQVRPVNLFGPYDYSYSRLVPAMMRSVVKNKPVIIHEEAKSVYRDLLYAPEAARMIRVLLESKTKENIYNLSACEPPKTIPEHVKEFCAAMKYENVETLTKGTSFSEIQYQSISGHRFMEEFSYHSELSKSRQILETYAWYEKRLRNA
jgi:nucleoside-diphosphate-sugar epimerase